MIFKALLSFSYFSKGGLSATKIRKSQILNNLLGFQTYHKSCTLWIFNLRIQSFCVICESVICGFVDLRLADLSFFGVFNTPASPQIHTFSACKYIIKVQIEICTK
jgi:hypothetical protein